MPQTQFTEQEIQVLNELGLDFNSENLENQILQLLKDDPLFKERTLVAEKQATELFTSTQENFTPSEPLEFSPEALAVFEAGRELWKYYHSQISKDSSSLRNPQNSTSFDPLEGVNFNVNASLYDIREYFQGRNPLGKMNNKSEDAEYNRLIANLRDKLKVLSLKIQPKVYEYGFLRG